MYRTTLAPDMAAMAVAGAPACGGSVHGNRWRGMVDDTSRIASSVTTISFATKRPARHLGGLTT